jgi:hypothetical protein
MVATPASAAQDDLALAHREVSLVRLHVLRAAYLLLVVGIGAMVLPPLVSHAPNARGVIPSLLAGVGVLALLGLRHPLQMLPLLMFELVWKAIWLFVFGIPQWFSGELPPTFADDFKAITAGVVLMPIVIPWGHVWRHYVKKPGESWR